MVQQAQGANEAAWGMKGEVAPVLQCRHGCCYQVTAGGPGNGAVLDAEKPCGCKKCGALP